MYTVEQFHDAVIFLQPLNLLDYVDVIPEFIPMKDCAQEPMHHAEGDVLVHANLAANEVLMVMDLIDVPHHEKVALYLATILHDIGKPSTFAFHPKKGTITAYGHDKAGVSLAKEFLKKYFPEIAFAQRDTILSLIEHHMQPREFMKTGTKDVKLKRLSLEVNVQLLYFLSMADTLGRKAENMSGCELLEKFKAECQRLNIWDQFYIVPGTEHLNNHAYTLARWDVLKNGKPENEETFDKALDFSNKRPKFQLLIMCGVAGSGKSTYVENLLKQVPDTKVINMDKKRQELLGDVNDQSQNQTIFDVCLKELRAAMQNKKNTIWDNTSLTRDQRRIVIDVARKQGALIGAVVFDLSFQTILERNAARERKVPEDVIEKQYKRFESVLSYEADKITVIDH